MSMNDTGSMSFDAAGSSMRDRFAFPAKNADVNEAAIERNGTVIGFGTITDLPSAGGGDAA
jgi:hypothetical protein